MAESEHVAEKKKGEFCSNRVAGGNCACGNNYQRTGKPAKWSWPYQAHHLLPVTCVNSELMSKPEIDGVLRATKWCINEKKNMKGMPTWGHTVKYYCLIKASVLWVRNPSSGTLSAPPWRDIPQHLIDHNLYTEEVRKRLTSLVLRWTIQKHTATSQNIAATLDAYADAMDAKLDKRGIRKGGTHHCWTEATKGDFPGWYEHFSMSESPTEKPFPARVEGAIESLLKILNS